MGFSGNSHFKVYPHIERIVIFIDGNNLMQGAKQFKKEYRIDYAKLISFLTGEHKLVRAYFFDCAPDKKHPDYQKKEGFIDMLRANGITVFERPLRYHSDGRPFQKGVDVALATEMLSLCMQDAYDTAIVVSGDSDYAHAIDRVKHTGKNVHCASFHASLSSDLKKVADKIIVLDKHADKFEFKKTEKNNEKFI
ncbi:MAG: NYN domain-containing protein [Candidatus Woesearchaeota archaeon]